MILKKQKQEFLKELEEKFNEFKEKAGFNSSFEKINKLFHIKDYFLSKGFVPETFNRALIAVMFDLYNFWNNYFFNLLHHPNSNILLLTEHKILTEEDKKTITKLIQRIMILKSENNYAIFKKDIKLEGKLIDKMVTVWEEEFEPFIRDLASRIKDKWNEEYSKKEENKDLKKETYLG